MLARFRAPPRLVRDRLRLLELADQRVLLGAGLERRQRRRIEPVTQQRKVAFRRQRHDGKDVIVQRALAGEIQRDRNADRQRHGEDRDRQTRGQHARDRHHQEHDEQHEGARLLIAADRVDEDKGPRHAEEQIEQDEAQPPGAEIGGARRFFEKLPAGADDHEMDDQRAGGPHPGGERSGPQAGKKPDGDNQEQDHQRSRQAVLGELAQQFVVEDRPRAAGRGQPIAGFAHMLGGKAALGRGGDAGRSGLARFTGRAWHYHPRLAMMSVKGRRNSLRASLRPCPAAG